MIPKEKNYVYGSAAPKIEYNVYEENKVLKAKKNQRANNRIKFKMVFTIFIVFLAFFSIIYMYAQITEVNYKLNKLNKEYNNIKNDNIQTKLEMEKNLDLNRVREIAQTRLDMQKPDKYQIVYLKVPKSDVTKVAEADNAGISSKAFIASVIDVFGKLTHFLD